MASPMSWPVDVRVVGRFLRIPRSGPLPLLFVDERPVRYQVYVPNGAVSRDNIYLPVGMHDLSQPLMYSPFPSVGPAGGIPAFRSIGGVVAFEVTVIGGTGAVPDLTYAQCVAAAERPGSRAYFGAGGELVLVLPDGREIVGKRDCKLKAEAYTAPPQGAAKTGPASHEHVMPSIELCRSSAMYSVPQEVKSNSYLTKPNPYLAEPTLSPASAWEKTGQAVKFRVKRVRGVWHLRFADRLKTFLFWDCRLIPWLKHDASRPVTGVTLDMRNYDLSDPMPYYYGHADGRVTCRPFQGHIEVFEVEFDGVEPNGFVLMYEQCALWSQSEQWRVLTVRRGRWDSEAPAEPVTGVPPAAGKVLGGRPVVMDPPQMAPTPEQLVSLHEYGICCFRCNASLGGGAPVRRNGSRSRLCEPCAGKLHGREHPDTIAGSVVPAPVAKQVLRRQRFGAFEAVETEPSPRGRTGMVRGPVGVSSPYRAFHDTFEQACEHASARDLDLRNRRLYESQDFTS